MPKRRSTCYPVLVSSSWCDFRAIMTAKTGLSKDEINRIIRLSLTEVYAKSFEKWRESLSVCLKYLLKHCPPLLRGAQSPRTLFVALSYRTCHRTAETESKSPRWSM